MGRVFASTQRSVVCGKPLGLSCCKITMTRFNINKEVNDEKQPLKKHKKKKNMIPENQECNKVLKNIKNMKSSSKKKSKVIEIMKAGVEVGDNEPIKQKKNKKKNKGNNEKNLGNSVEINIIVTKDATQSKKKNKRKIKIIEKNDDISLPKPKKVKVEPASEEGMIGKEINSKGEKLKKKKNKNKLKKTNEINSDNSINLNSKATPKTDLMNDGPAKISNSTLPDKIKKKKNKKKALLEKNSEIISPAATTEKKKRNKKK